MTKKTENANENNSLNDLLTQEKRKLASNIFRLAGLYAPYGRLPDFIDYAAMAKRIPAMVANESNYVYALWPTSTDKLFASIKVCLGYVEQQHKAINALKAAGAKCELTEQQLFEHALDNDSNARRMRQQMGAVA